jgi:hypothetical protein
MQPLLCLLITCTRNYEQSIEGQGVTALPCFVAKASGLVPILPEQTVKQDVWLMRHLDTKDSDYSTLISETIEKELQEYLL